MKGGVFKSLEITGKDIDADGIPVPYLNIKTLTDYNRVDINKKPAKVISDMTLSYNLELSEESINTALKNKAYSDKLSKVNKLAYPFFVMNDVRIKIQNDRIYTVMDYKLPLVSKKNKVFVVSCDFKVENGKIKATNIGMDKAYGNISLDKVTNLINLLDPLSFTLDLMKDDNCKGRIENVEIKDNFVKIDGKIFIKGEV